MSFLGSAWVRARTPGDASAAEVVEQGHRPMTARRKRTNCRRASRWATGSGRGSAGGRRKRRGVSVRLPAAAAARRHARRRGPARWSGAGAAPAAAWLATGTTGAFTAAASPAHSPAGGANPGADWDPRSPRPPASLGAAGGPSCLVRPTCRRPVRHWRSARSALVVQVIQRRQRWFPTAPPKSYSTRRSAGWPAPTHGAGTAASPGCAAARRRR